MTFFNSTRHFPSSQFKLSRKNLFQHKENSSFKIEKLKNTINHQRQLLKNKRSKISTFCRNCSTFKSSTRNFDILNFLDFSSTESKTSVKMQIPRKKTPESLAFLLNTILHSVYFISLYLPIHFYGILKI